MKKKQLKNPETKKQSGPKKQKLPLSNILIFILVIVLFVGLFYMSSFFREKEENVRAENPIVFCQPPDVPPEEKECFFTTHIHYYLIVDIFGELQTLGFESGLLQSFHTHSEKNKLHWHTLLPADPETKEPKQLPTLQNLLDDVSKTLNLAEKELEVFVDGKKIDDPQDYILDLKKEQTIKVVFT